MADTRRLEWLMKQMEGMAFSWSSFCDHLQDIGIGSSGEKKRMASADRGKERKPAHQHAGQSRQESADNGQAHQDQNAAGDRSRVSAPFSEPPTVPTKAIDQ